MINKFNIKPKDLDQLLNAWTADAAYLKQRSPASSIHSFIGALEEVACLSIMQYGSLEAHFKQATSDPAFRSALAPYPDRIVASPYLSLEKLQCLESVSTKLR